MNLLHAAPCLVERPLRITGRAISGRSHWKDEGMPAKTWFQTTAIDYPNSRPHIGTAFEKIGADVQARYRRMEGYDVFFLMGNDENTVKVVASAPPSWATTRKPTATTWPGSSRRSGTPSTSRYDDFIQTSERAPPRSAAGSSSRRCTTTGTSTRASYEGWYCDGCEAFKTEKESREDGGAVPEPPRRRSIRRSRSSATSSGSRRSRTGCWSYYEENPDFIQPESRRNEIVSLVETEGLQDVNITRTGEDVGHPRPVRPGVHDLRLVRRPAELHHRHRLRRRRGDVPQVLAGRRPLHRQGHHAVPLRPLAGDADVRPGSQPPQQVFGHGFVYIKNEETGEVEKISKSLGNVVEPMEIITKFSAEAFRYYFMRECPFPGDGEFGWQRFAEVYNCGPGEQPRQPLQPRRDAHLARTSTGVLRRHRRQGAGRRSCRSSTWRRSSEQVRGHVEACQYNLALQTICAGLPRRRPTSTSKRTPRGSW